jgi:predicted TIM-barrel fold metal-dependent hydrolase
MRFAHPLYLDDVAADLPSLAIIIAHVAKPFWREALMVASAKPNISLDISGWQGEPLDHFYGMLRTALDMVGPWRIFFASDGPFLNMACPLDRWVKMLIEPDLTSCPGFTFLREEMDIITGMAFARLLKLR